MNAHIVSKLLDWKAGLPANLQVDVNSHGARYLPHVILLQYGVPLHPAQPSGILSLTLNVQHAIPPSADSRAPPMDVSIAHPAESSSRARFKTRTSYMYRVGVVDSRPYSALREPLCAAADEHTRRRHCLLRGVAAHLRHGEPFQHCLSARS